MKTFEKNFYTFIKNSENEPLSVEQEYLNFWKHYDEIFHTNHSVILSALSNYDANYCTLEGLALKLNVCERTLSRYRKLYTESYLTFLPS